MLENGPKFPNEVISTFDKANLSEIILIRGVATANQQRKRSKLGLKDLMSRSI